MELSKAHKVERYITFAQLEWYRELTPRLYCRGEVFFIYENVKTEEEC